MESRTASKCIQVLIPVQLLIVSRTMCCRFSATVSVSRIAVVNQAKAKDLPIAAGAGVVSGKYVFCLPGSPGASRDGWDEILKPQLDYRHKPCNFIEIMPRLDEHLKRK